MENGQTVSRAHLFDSDAASESSASEADISQIRASINAHLGADFSTLPQPTPEQSPHAKIPPSDDNVQFRLFATSPTQVANLRLASPDLSNKPAGFVKPRPDSHYLRGKLDEVTREEIARSVLSGEDIISLSKVPWPGCRLQWRVVNFPPQKTPVHVKPEGEGKGRKRIGKKARIAKRKIFAAWKDKLEKEEQEHEEKELARKAKLAQRNRVKKMKKRQRDKEKKEALELTGRPSTVGVGI